jgi:tetratricopeptide (TPR) repeat protein
MGAKILALLFLGRLGEVLRIVRTETELAEKNGGDPWIHVLGELQLRWICFDYDGVQRLGGSLMRSNSEQHALRARTFTLLAAGHAEILRGDYTLALRCFEQVRDFQRTPRFLLHWYWRIWAEHGTAEALLSAGDLAKARRAADGFLKAALRASDPSMQALAWELQTRLSAAENDRVAASHAIAKALEVLEQAEAPVAGWRVHATASDWYAGEGDWEKAAAHRTHAHELIQKLADSFPPGEPLRESFLSAAPVRRLLGQAVSA